MEKKEEVLTVVLPVEAMDLSGKAKQRKAVFSKELHMASRIYSTDFSYLQGLHKVDVGH